MRTEYRSCLSDEEIAIYAGNDCTDKERELLSSHVSSCVPCHNLVEEVRTIIKQVEAYYDAHPEKLGMLMARIERINEEHKGRKLN